MPQRPVPRTVGAAVCLVAGLGLLAGCRGGTVELDAPSLSGADETACHRLIDALPDTVADQPMRAVATGDGYGAAWGDPAIELRCGVGAPEGFDEFAACTTVNGVDWFIPEEDLEPGGDLVMTTVKRAQYVEVRFPGDYWPPAATLANLAPAISNNIAATGHCV